MSDMQLIQDFFDVFKQRKRISTLLKLVGPELIRMNTNYSDSQTTAAKDDQ